jgi:DNA-binding NtrC family response regulator
MKLGATDFFTKPFDLAALELTVDRTLDNVRLRRGVAGLAAEPEDARGTSQLVGASPAMQNLRDMIAKVARSDASTVLIGGESGSGKDVVARAIHASSRRAQKPFMTINCTSLPEALAESELLGHERGAFTDAKSQKKGLFELADSGTAFLDEIGDMALGTQAKLLRLLEEKTFKRVGGTVDVRVDVRVVAATHRNLRAAVSAERFRQDLYFRLNIVSIHVPALRDHIEDLPALCAQFVATYNQALRRNVEHVTPEALETMSRYHWPGNVRELRNVIERAFILEATRQIGLEHLPPEIRCGKPSTPLFVAPSPPTLRLADQEMKMIRDALEQTSGNQTHAARLLGITRDTLRYRMKKFGLV